MPMDSPLSGATEQNREESSMENAPLIEMSADELGELVFGSSGQSENSKPIPMEKLLALLEDVRSRLAARADNVSPNGQGIQLGESGRLSWEGRDALQCRRRLRIRW